MSGGHSRSPDLSAKERQAVFDVRITTRAARPSLEFSADGILQVRVNAAPVDGAANKALLKIVAGALRIAPSRVSLVSGHHSRLKRISIEGLDVEDVRERLRAASLKAGSVSVR